MTDVKVVDTVDAGIVQQFNSYVVRTLSLIDLFGIEHLIEIFRKLSTSEGRFGFNNKGVLMRKEDCFVQSRLKVCISKSMPSDGMWYFYEAEKCTVGK